MSSLNTFAKAERYLQKALGRLPSWLSRFFGYRHEEVPQSPTWVICLWGFIGAFGVVGSLFAVFGHMHYFTSRLVPPILVSFGASAVLCFSAVHSSHAQPRALIFGHLFSALIGIIIAIIFGFNLRKNENPPLQWLAAALAVAIALVVMRITRTTHSPAGATALLPVVDRHVWALRWYFLPVVLLCSALVLASALLVNNIQRQYPRFWIAPVAAPGLPVSRQHRHRTPGTPVPNMQQQSPRNGRSPQELESGR